VFGGEVSALKLNVDFADAGLIHGAAAIRFGDLLVSNLTATPDLNGLTVRGVLATLNTALSGGGTPRSRQRRAADRRRVLRGLAEPVRSGPSRGPRARARY
jgi:hypothetical protein